MRVKINTLNEKATITLRDNLIDKKIPFEQKGTAFLVDKLDIMLQPHVFNGLWVGADGNINEEYPTNEDQQTSLYLH